MPLDENQYEFLDEELTFEEACSRCNEKNARLVEPKDIETNDKLRELSGNKEFWIGIKDNKYVSDNQLITWSNNKPKSEEDTSNDKSCKIMVEVKEKRDFDSDFGMWSGVSCTTKKFSAVCDKKKGKDF